MFELTIHSRKLVIIRETIRRELEIAETHPITRAIGLAIVANPFAGRSVEDLSELFRTGAAIGEQLIDQLVPLLPGPVVSYGKGAIVGLKGELEHGGACIHPMLGKPIRAAVGGGKSLIPSNVKVASAGTALDVPLGHKDNAWSFDHFDTVTVSVADGPREDEIVVVVAIADGGRPWPRCGAGPVTDPTFSPSV